MYMQNVLSAIEHKIDNEVRYTIHFKQVVANQISKEDEVHTKELDEAIKKQKVPQTIEEMSEYQNKVKAQIEKKYSNLIKNAHQYLSYMNLLNNNYNKCISHGKKLLAIQGCAQNTQYIIHMYIAESLCMLGRFEESFTHLELAEGFSSQGIVKQVELKFRTINVSRQSDEKISEEIITKLNKCVVHICAGQFDTAR